jgi:nitrogen-specific signal transduction histidine kinase/ActR/RegA family two-component response regulator
VGLAEWRDGEGKRFFTGILRDLSERKRSEEALAAALRLEAVGQLAGGVAHDFNNLLAVIAGNLELAGDRITDEIARDLIHRALNAAEKGSGLNRRLLFLARKRTLTPQQRLNLNACVEDIAKLLKTTLGELIEVGAELAAGLWMTVADPAEIDSAILNITTNARDAMPHGGRLRISTGNVMIDAPAAATLHPDARPGEYVRLVLADNGVGMSQDVLGKAMEPFFTTKGPGTGTGLGLASVASFARQTGGFITLESAPGCGCAVSLYLPRAAEDLPVLKTDDDDLPLGDGELVLVVEDDDQVREVTLKRIESLGYAVTEARTGPEAVQRLKSEEPVQLVLSDIVMPGGMTGYDVARWVTSNRPGMQIILCSGHHDEDPESDVRTPIRDVIVLGKPYSREQLARALSNALALARMSGGLEILLQEL